MAVTTGTIIFERKSELRENAFTLQVPQGWLLEGGIQRANHMVEQVTAQTIEAKADFAVKKDAQGSVMLRFCPEMKYADPRYLMGYFPTGSNYGGRIVCPLMPAQQFLAQIYFPWAHPQASQAQMVSAQPWEDTAVDFRQRAQKQGLPFAYEGVEVVFSYSEGGVDYKEKAYTVIENTGQAIMGQWSNKNTWYMRAPVGEYDAWEPTLRHIQRSTKFNTEWLAQEMAMQEFLTGAFKQALQADQMRAQRARELQQYLQQVDREILEHRRQTFDEIRNDNYLTLTSQEEYVNPYTNEIDTGSNEYNYRWVTPSGDEYYTNEEFVNPNNDGGALNRQDWKPTPIRPRKPYQ